VDWLKHFFDEVDVAAAVRRERAIRPMREAKYRLVTGRLLDCPVNGDTNR
jgi:hypothetical protein